MENAQLYAVGFFGLTLAGLYWISSMLGVGVVLSVAGLLWYRRTLDVRPPVILQLA